MSKERFDQYFKEKRNMLEHDYAQTLAIGTGTVIYCALLVTGLFLTPVPLLDYWTLMVVGSVTLVIMSIFGYWHKHWKYSNFDRWKRSQRRK